ncbi:MAG: hypothetical protein IT208_00935 [Chthonomonadales bacterium]|nr:hypothetical protein [Chthonomonadales bacterium]
MPIGTDLVLRESPAAEEVVLDGDRLGRTVEAAARRFGTPIALPLMDLSIEKAVLLHALDVADHPTYHFSKPPSAEIVGSIRRRLEEPATPRLRASVDAVGYIAEHTDLVPCAMAIGPFSLMTKLLADPITPVYLAGTGVTAEEDADVRAVEAALELADEVILHSLSAQIRAGARLAVIAEPAANMVYFSPRQLEKGSDIFERYAMRHNRRIKEMLDRAGVDLFFHCCGELTDEMVRQFGGLDPVVLSLGGSRNLWEDAALVPDDVVLYGNLPSKRFYSDDLTAEAVGAMARDMLRRMGATGHPYILGTECDVLSVPGRAATIASKVRAFMEAPRG